MKRAVVLIALILALVPAVPRAHGPVPHHTIARLTALTGVTSTTEPPAPTVAAACPVTRNSEGNAPDAVGGARWQVIYFVPSDACDYYLDADATPSTLEKSMNALNSWFVTNGFKPMRMDRTSLGGPMDVRFVKGLKPKASYTGIDAIADELRSRGLNESGKRYIAFAEVNTGGVCGEAYWPGDWAMTYLGSVSGCGTRDFSRPGYQGKSEVVTAQETLHNEGILYLDSPHKCLSTPAHVCTAVLGELGIVGLSSLDPESSDALFPYVFGQRINQKVLDRGHDDYFKTSLTLDDLEESPYFG